MKQRPFALRYILVFIILLAYASGQSRIDVIHLKDGTIYKGKIIENIIDEYIKIELFSREIRSCEYLEIIKITAEIDLTKSDGFTGDGKIIIRTDPPNAVVTAGGKNFGKSPVLIADLPSGDLQIIVEKDGNLRKKETVFINGLDQLKITIALENKTGSALFDSNPENVEIYLNGNLVGNTPFTINGLDLGRYKVIYQKVGYLNEEGFIDIKYNSNSTYERNLIFVEDLITQQKKYARRSVLMFGASTIAILAGGYSYFQSEKEYDAYKNASSSEIAKEKRNLVEQMDSAGPMAFGSAGALAIPAIYFLIKSISIKNIINVGQK